jgi:hypothetical protein
MLSQTIYQLVGLDHYRAPTPATLAGARVLTTAEAELCWKTGGLSVLRHSLVLHIGCWRISEPNAGQ